MFSCVLECNVCLSLNEKKYVRQKEYLITYYAPTTRDLSSNVNNACTRPEVPIAREQPAANVSALLIGELHVGMVRSVNTDCYSYHCGSTGSL